MRCTDMRIAICGPGESGKDVAAGWLHHNTPLRFISGTSYYAADQVFERLQGTSLGEKYSTALECWEDRRNHRQLWAEVIAEINRKDPVALYRRCLEQQDILSGIRWAHEQKAVREAELVDLWVWIDREDVPHDPTMQYGPDECDLVIPNNGPLEDLFGRLERICRAIGVYEPSIPEAWIA